MRKDRITVFYKFNVLHIVDNGKDDITLLCHIKTEERLYVCT
jgi:hypothetical protein